MVDLINLTFVRNFDFCIFAVVNYRIVIVLACLVFELPWCRCKG